MLKKTIIGLLIVVLIISTMVMPASAATYNYNDYVINTGVEGDKDLFSVSFPQKLNRLHIADWHNASHTVDTRIDSDNILAHTTWFDDCPNDLFFFVYRPLGNHGVKLDNIPSGSTFTSNIVIDVKTTKSDYALLMPYMVIRYYDSDGALIGKSSSVYTTEIGEIGTSENGKTKGRTGQVVFDCTTTINKPTGAAYANFWFYIDVDMAYETEGNIYTFTLKDGGTLTFGIPSSYGLQQSLGQSNELLGDINDNIEELPGEIGDEFQDIIDQENQAASDAGDSAAGELVDLVPNESEGFINAIRNLVASMSYNGTSANLPIPAITLPAIDGVMPAIKLTDELSCDFGFWIEKLPSDILQLVRILCTIALIVYCFKELYGTISYALTLKGGGNSE